MEKGRWSHGSRVPPVYAVDNWEYLSTVVPFACLCFKARKTRKTRRQGLGEKSWAMPSN